MHDISEEMARVFHAFFDYLQEVDQMLAISIYSIHGMKGRGELAKVATLGRRSQKGQLPAGELDDAERQYIEEAKELEALAMRQAASGFPMLYAHASVALWSTLEATIPDIATQVLAEDLSLLQHSVFEKVRLPASILSEPASEQASMVISEFMRQVNLPYKQGVGRFSALLDAVELSVSTDENTRRALLELSQVRNNIVHRVSIVDKPLKRACPWLAYAVGERLKISSDDYIRYRESVVAYVELIVACFRRKLSHQVPLNQISEARSKKATD